MKYKSKRTFRAAVAGLFCASTLIYAMPAMPASAVLLAGDITLDGNVDLKDIVKEQQYLLRACTLSGDAGKNADYNADGVCNVLDLVLLKQAVLNLTDPIADAIFIHLSDNGITVEGDKNGVTSVNGKTITITSSGNYKIDGNITDGQIHINVPDTTTDAGDVELYLQNVTMTSATGEPCIYTESAVKTKLTLTGTNTFTDTASTANTVTSGVIYADGKLTVTKNSTGSLHVTSSMNAGLYASKNINLNGGSININTDVDDLSDADAIKTKKTLTVEGATLNVDSSADGLKSTKEEINIISGTITVKASNDAIQAATAINISGGTTVAGGDRGFRLDDTGTLNITGGNVLATATDYQITDSTSSLAMIDLSGSTQNIMLLDFATEQKKNQSITVQQNGKTVYEMTTNKKCSYALLSGSGITTSNTYTVAVNGTVQTHTKDIGTTSPESNFTMNSNTTEFYNVQPSDTTITSDETTVTEIAFSDSNVILKNASGTDITNKAEGVSISGSTVTIQTPLTASVTGKSSNAQLIINVDKTTYPTGIVELDLQNVTLSNTTVAPIYVESIGDEVVLSSPSGTVNTISDGTTHTDTYIDSDGDTNTICAAIFSRDDLKLKGKGSLTVNGNTEDGIVSKNDLKIWNGTVTVNAVDDGIRGKDSVRIGNPDATDFSTLNVTVNTNNTSGGGDGIKSTSAESGKGYVVINGGTIYIDSYADGIQAEQDFTMNNGNLTIQTYQGSTYNHSSSSFGGSWGQGGWGGNNSNKTDISAKGIKAVGLYDTAGTTWQSEGNITINGGTISIDASDDALHCGGDMNLLGGNITLATADDGAHSDHALTIGTTGSTNYNSPYIEVTKSYEGIEGVDITVNSGSVIVTSSDDGFNAAGGTDGSGNGNNGGWGQGGWGGSMSGNGNQTLTFHGGYTYVNAAGDGIDSNGSLTVDGGYVFVSQTGGGNSPIDCDSTWSYNGGVVIAGGSSDMFSESIPNNYQLVNQSAGISAGTTVAFTNNNGSILGTMTFANNAAAIVVCAPESGTTYTGGTLSDVTYFANSTINNKMTAGYGGTITNGTALSNNSSGNGSNRPGGR